MLSSNATNIATKRFTESAKTSVHRGKGQETNHEWPLCCTALKTNLVLCGKTLHVGLEMVKKKKKKKREKEIKTSVSEHSFHALSRNAS